MGVLGQGQLSVAHGENYKKEKDILGMRANGGGGKGRFEKDVPNSNT